MEDQIAPPVMILGCGRSGTSIFGELFDHLPMYDYRSEPPFAGVINADFSSPLAFKVPYESNGFAAGPGLTFPLAKMRRAQPRMHFFWIVRHPLDAVCSLRVGIAKNWGHHPRPPDWREWLGRPLIEQCAHHWSFINSAGFAQIADIATVVRFEDMLSAPKDFAGNALRSLGLNPAMYDGALDEWAQRIQNTNNADFDEAETSRSYSRIDHSVRVGRWRENLTEFEVATILPIVTAIAESLGYDMREPSS